MCHYTELSNRNDVFRFSQSMGKLQPWNVFILTEIR